MALLCMLLAASPDVRSRICHWQRPRPNPTCHHCQPCCSDLSFPDRPDFFHNGARAVEGAVAVADEPEAVREMPLCISQQWPKACPRTPNAPRSSFRLVWSTGHTAARSGVASSHAHHLLNCPPGRATQEAPEWEYSQRVVDEIMTAYLRLPRRGSDSPIPIQDMRAVN
ncbi:hypothetical protein B0T24DRAFT_289344 [Lasiosphaeria ovina]|uniref:Uncharacterized protein n=1 Tax=Lasiosphaeria ovina TaxID=92902 RepID=A0AAE0KCS6_9PEZI|nr:hypothetical protein B0T24DRAFT_289344 [Lasiosphaeria ovina]